MYLFNLKIQALKHESVKTDGSSALKMEVLTALDSSFESAILYLNDYLEWTKTKALISDIIEKTKESLISEYDNEMQEVISRMLDILTQEITDAKNKTCDNFFNSYRSRAKKEFDLDVNRANVISSNEIIADTIIKNFIFIYSQIVKSDIISSCDKIKIIQSLHKDNVFNGHGYRHFDFLLMKIITDDEVIERQEMFYKENNTKGFLFELIEKNKKRSPLFYTTAMKYLNGVYEALYKHKDFSSRVDILFNTRQAIYDVIDENAPVISDKDKFVLEIIKELNHKIANYFSRIKIRKDLLDNFKTIVNGLPQEQTTFLLENIEKLQNRKLIPIKQEEMPALYENEELLIAYFRMVNYLLMNYPEAVGKEAYKNFVINLKLIMTNSQPDNKANKPLIYAEMERLYNNDEPLYSIEVPSRDALFGYADENRNYEFVPLFVDFDFQTKIIKGYIDRLFN